MNLILREVAVKEGDATMTLTFIVSNMVSTTTSSSWIPQSILVLLLLGNNPIMTRQLGRKPILTFGNSSGDYPMFEFVISNHQKIIRK